MHSRLGIERMFRVAVVGAAIAAITVLGTSSPAAGLTINVTSTADSGAGTLRQAIFDANATAGLDTIALPAGTFALTSALVGITQDLIITGQGAGVSIIQGDYDNMLFIISPGRT